jgi:hypothetical protein
MIKEIEYAGDIIRKIIDEATTICKSLNMLANTQQIERTKMKIIQIYTYILI